ncbi:MAG: hypothetical protein WD492_05050 [Alkalispirochaeta sp.]
MRSPRPVWFPQPAIVPRHLFALFLAATLVPVTSFFATPAAVAAQDLDEFFNEPDEVSGGEDEAGAEDAVGTDDSSSDDGDGRNAGDAADPPPAEGGAVDIGALTTSPTRVRGNVSADAGVSLGYNEWPGSDAAEARTVRDLLEVSAGYAMSASMSVDSRPRPYLRFYTKLFTTLSTEDLDFGPPTVGALFVDYTLNDNIFFRAGKFGMGWGRARLFDSPADLVSRVDDGAGIRVSVPAGRGSLTTVLYTRPQWIGTKEGQYEQGDPRSFGGAAQWEQSFGAFSTELSGHYQLEEGPQTAATVTLGVGEVTLSAEGRYDIDPDHPDLPGTEDNPFTAIGNFFWENSSRTWSFWGEYSYDAARGDDSADGGTGDDEVLRDGTHLTGLAMKAPSLGSGGWRPQMSWRHSVADASGQIIAGTSGSIAPGMELSVGLPVFYGRAGTFYRGIADTRIVPDDNSGDDQEDQVLRISGSNVVSVSLGLSLSFSF